VFIGDISIVIFFIISSIITIIYTSKQLHQHVTVYLTQLIVQLSMHVFNIKLVSFGLLICVVYNDELYNYVQLIRTTILCSVLYLA